MLKDIPNDETGLVLQSYVKDGSDLSKPMKIDFFIGLPSKKAGKLIFDKLTKGGFDVSIEYDSDDDEWTCYCSKVLVASYENVIAIEEKLSSLAMSSGCIYEGFGSYGNAP